MPTITGGFRIKNGSMDKESAEKFKKVSKGNSIFDQLSKTSEKKIIKEELSKEEKKDIKILINKAKKEVKKEKKSKKGKK